MADKEEKAFISTWKVNPIIVDETLLFQALVKKGEYGTRGCHLPEARQIEIQQVAQNFQMDLYQALSLRRQILMWGFRQQRNFYSAGNAHQQQDYANSFEQIVVNFLSSQSNMDNIVTERKIKELMKENEGAANRSNRNGLHLSWSTSSKLYRRTIYAQETPDVIFIKPVTINGKTVNWIDCKAYYGAWMIHKDTRYGCAPLNKVPKQIDRYNKAYGQGAILFLRGFHKRLADSWLARFNCLLLDATDLDISIFNTR